MRGKTLLISIACLVFVGIASGWFWLNFFKPKPVSPLTATKDSANSRELPSETKKEYVDPSGFRFEYPEDVVVISSESKEGSVYANLAITEKSLTGGITVKIEDTKASSLEKWFKENKLALVDSTDGITLGGLPAGEGISGSKRTRAAIDQGVIFIVTVDIGDTKDFWMNVYDTLLASFSFVSQPALGMTQASGNLDTEDIVFEEEETIE